MLDRHGLCENVGYFVIFGDIIVAVYVRNRLYILFSLGN